MNSHGDERKISLKEELSPGTAEEMIRLCRDFPLTVLKVTFWNNFPPWEVPERRINDNLGLFVDSGFLRFRTGGEERILSRGDQFLGLASVGKMLHASGNDEIHSCEDLLCFAGLFLRDHQFL